MWVGVGGGVGGVGKPTTVQHVCAGLQETAGLC